MGFPKAVWRQPCPYHCRSAPDTGYTQPLFRARNGLKFTFHSIRISILTQLAFLILAAMLLISVVMLTFQEHTLIQEKLKQGRLLSLMLTLQFKDMENQSAVHRSWQTRMEQLIQSAGFSGACLMDQKATVFLDAGSRGELRPKGIAQARQALITGKNATRFFGQTWGVLWLASDAVVLSAPVLDGPRIMGSVAVWSTLHMVYQEIRRSEKLLLIYIFLNTLVLISGGLFLLSRSVVKPVHKLLRITEAFRKGALPPLFPDVSENEMGQLNRSLKLMLKRLEENKRELQAHIASLEKANTAIRKSQADLIKSEKLASVGRLAAGIAHEIGNPMGIILGYIDLLKGENLTASERKDFLRRVESELTRINDIIRQLLDFSRPAGGRPEKTSVHQVILATLKMLEPQPLMAHIESDIRLNASNDVVWADPNQLQQVFLNLIMNAADAMKTEKHLIIKTSTTDKVIRVQFEDSGTGIPEADLEGIFDPFYTSKPPGRGTGLGLSVSYTIVQGIGGTIGAENNPDRGISVTIEIPLHGEKTFEAGAKG